MVKYSCHIHLTQVVRVTTQPPHQRVVVTPAGTGETCDVCGKKAIWIVNPE